VKLAALTATVILACLAAVHARWRSPERPVDWPTRLAVLAVAALFLGYFVVVLQGGVIQSGVLQGEAPTERTGDLGVYLRAAWAAGEGEDIYQATDFHGWHYLYPPLLASLLVPFADPPESASAAARAGAIPYGVSLALWYWLGVVCLLVSVNMIASALARIGPGAAQARFSQGWWNLRLLPLLIVLPFALDDLRRGQTTAIILLCLAGCSTAILHGRSFRAGAWLGAAAALKLFPLYLLIYPLWRRDGRFLAATLAAAFVASLVPAAVMGWGPASSAYRTFIAERLVGEASGAGDPAVADELHGTNTGVQSFEYMTYDALHPNRDSRDPAPPQGYFFAHIVLSLTLSAAVLWAMRRRRDRFGEYLFFAALVLLAIPMLPVARPHYFLLGILAVSGLFVEGAAPAAGWRPARYVGAAALAFLAAAILDAARLGWALDFGVASLAALALAALALNKARRAAVLP
jgi:hypothetical protein